MISTSDPSAVPTMMLSSKEPEISPTFNALGRILGIPYRSLGYTQLLDPFNVVRHRTELQVPKLSFSFLVDKAQTNYQGIWVFFGKREVFVYED